jgi:hypothetical protein
MKRRDAEIQRCKEDYRYSCAPRTWWHKNTRSRTIGRAATVWTLWGNLVLVVETLRTRLYHRINSWYSWYSWFLSGLSQQRPCGLCWKTPSLAQIFASLRLCARPCPDFPNRVREEADTIECATWLFSHEDCASCGKVKKGFGIAKPLPRPNAGEKPALPGLASFF